MSNSTLYKDEGIVFNEDWANTYVTEGAQLENDDNEWSVMITCLKI